MLFYQFKMTSVTDMKEVFSNCLSQSDLKKTERERWKIITEEMNKLLWEHFSIATEDVMCAFSKCNKKSMTGYLTVSNHMSLEVMYEKISAFLKEMCEIENVTYSAEEITAESFMQSIKNIEREKVLGYDLWEIKLKDTIDYFRNSCYDLKEIIVNEVRLTKSAALNRAREIMADKSLLEELTRIYSSQNKKEFFGHPVHYKITAKSRSAIEDIVDLLIQSLYTNQRLLGKRVSKICNIRENCYDEEDVVHILDASQGATVVIEMQGTDEENGKYASVYEQVVEFFSKMIKKYNRDTLFIFLEIRDEPGFGQSMMGHAKEYVSIIDIEEGYGKRNEAIKYFKMLMREYSKMNHGDINEYILNQQSSNQSLIDYSALFRNDVYSASELHQIYNQWYQDSLKRIIYKSYLTCNTEQQHSEKNKGDAYQRLMQMVGLEEVKAIIRQIIASSKIEKMQMSYSDSRRTSTKHMIFTGNPGSAKTTVARLLAEILRDNDILESGRFVECGRSDLIAKYVGWTAKTIQAKFREATGGILFIDEAYALVDDTRSFGDEAINTIVQEMENRRDKVIVIFAGYPKKMKEFLDKNEGLRSRIGFHINFPDYHADELMAIFDLMRKEADYQVTDEALHKCKEIFRYACGQEEFGNGRFVRNVFEQAVMKQSLRLMDQYGEQKIDQKRLFLLESEDFIINAEQQYKEQKQFGFHSI